MSAPVAPHGGSGIGCPLALAAACLLFLVFVAVVVS